MNPTAVDTAKHYALKFKAREALVIQVPTAALPRRFIQCVLNDANDWVTNVQLEWELQRWLFGGEFLHCCFYLDGCCPLSEMD